MQILKGSFDKYAEVRKMRKGGHGRGRLWSSSEKKSKFGREVLAKKFGICAMTFFAAANSISPYSGTIDRDHIPADL